jgi:hypothetical protein
MTKHTCAVCKKTRKKNKMTQIDGHWACACVPDGGVSGLWYCGASAYNTPKCCEHNDFKVLAKIKALKKELTKIKQYAN